jgi:MFS family permease
VSLTTRKPRTPSGAEETTEPASGGILRSIKVYPAFRMLMIGTLVSNTAFWMYQVAVGWLALQMTDSPFFVGMAGFAGGIPLLLVSLPAGVIIDRFDRRTVLMSAQVGVMLVAMLFAFLVATDAISRATMLVLVALYGTIMSFVFPTRTAIVPSLVERRDLANGVALNSAVQNATRVIGPSLAGVIIGILGVAETFALAAAMQLVALMATLRLPRLAPAPMSRGSGGVSGLLLGLRIVSGRPLLMALIVLALAPTVLVMPYINLMPVFARDVLDLGSTGLGVLLAATGLGTVGGSLWVARRPGSASAAGGQILPATAFAGCVIVFSMMPIVWLAVPVLFIAGWMSASFLAMNQTSLQLNVEDEVRGRVLSIYLLTWGMLPIGQLIVGAMASPLGTPLAMIVSAVAAIASIALIAWRFPALRSVPAAVATT